MLGHHCVVTAAVPALEREVHQVTDAPPTCAEQHYCTERYYSLITLRVPINKKVSING